MRTRQRTSFRHRPTRVRARARVGTLLLAAALAGLCAVSTPAAVTAATSAPTDSVPAMGDRWFALGASVPWLTYRCDFGCGLANGVRGERVTADRMLRTMSRRGVRVVRWYLFADDAWQVRRAADGTPTNVTSAAIHDLRAAAELAAKEDVFLLPVVLPDPDRVPATWFTDANQAAALATAMRPVFAAVSDDRHVLGWELATGAERLIDSGAATREQVRAHVSALQSALRATAPGRLAAIGTLDVSRIDTWTGLGANLYLPQDVTATSGEACALCRQASAVASAEGADAPIVIGGFIGGTTELATERLTAYAHQGYAGALMWSWRGLRHPLAPARPAGMRDTATWRFHYAVPRSGPRSRPLNPCYGPRVAAFACPNLKMHDPADVHAGRMGSRRVLFSTNSLDSLGDGPASIHGTRTGHFTMAAVQLLHRRDGGITKIDTGAKLLFKAVPGQYRYWKWNGAARMELWRLDSSGRPVERTRIGPKTVYCLRDLKRRAGWLDGSPPGRVFPGCSQNLAQQSVTLGTSVGWSDVYPSTYHENWIDVSGLRGCFAYVHVADPLNVIYESNEDDNMSSVVVRLPFTGSNAGCPGARPIPTTGLGGTY